MPTLRSRAALWVRLLAAGAFLSTSTAFGSDDTDTFVIRHRSTHSDVQHPAVETILGPADIGERFCENGRCVVLCGSPRQLAALDSFRKNEDLDIEPMPDAHRVFLRGATYDAKARAFDRDIRSEADSLPPADTGVFVIIFKTYPSLQIREDLAKSGVTLLEPTQTLSYFAYGTRSTIETLSERFRYVYGTVAVPPVLKRYNIDERLEGDGDDPAPTTVVLVSSAPSKKAVLAALESISGTAPTLIYTTGAVEALSTTASRLDAFVLSSFPEVVSITRDTFHASPSDERASRIVAGAFNSYGSSWPTSLGPNIQTPPFWTNYLGQLSSSFSGFNPANHVVGLLDTGIDSGLIRGGATDCPPYLRPTNYPSDPCKLVFTTDLSSAPPENVADDNYANGHGSTVASIIGGYAGSASSGRDFSNYAFTQGVAQGARFAVSRFFRNCGLFPYRREGTTELEFSDDRTEAKMRYSLVALGSTNTIPDYGTGPGARVFNHSWNMPGATYDATSVLLDQATRTLHAAAFTFRNNQLLRGSDVSSLHVVSAGNTTNNQDLVQAPATAKNVIAVGATETYNQEIYTAGCPNANAGNADNPRQIATLSRIGWSNQRVKPDLVAPGTRMYGLYSSEARCPTTCNPDLTGDTYGDTNYTWSNGTSFAAPVVTGAAVLAKEWLRTAGYTNASPALLKAALIATARSLTDLPSCATGCSPCCASCGAMQPAPDSRQGWGGVSLDKLFRPQSNYFIIDQATQFTAANQSVTYTLNVVNRNRDVSLALVWSDRAALEPDNAANNLTNDFDLSAFVPTAGKQYYGNVSFIDPNSCSRSSYSLPNPVGFTRDRLNNVERITIKASDLSVMTGQIMITVTANAIRGNGVNPNADTPWVQDYALFVDNAH